MVVFIAPLIPPGQLRPPAPREACTAELRLAASGKHQKMPGLPVTGLEAHPALPVTASVSPSLGTFSSRKDQFFYSVLHGDLNGKENPKKEGIIELIHFAVQQKLTQQYKATLLQCKRVF